MASYFRAVVTDIFRWREAVSSNPPASPVPLQTTESKPIALAVKPKKGVDAFDEWKLWESAPSRKADSAFARYGLAFVITAIALLFTLWSPVLRNCPFLLFFGAVMISAVYGGLVPAMVTIGLSALAIAYFLMPPYHRFFFDGGPNPEHTLQLMMFAMVSLIGSAFIAGCKRTRDYLRDSEERYRILAETASDAVLIIDQQARIIYVNPGAERISGHTREEMLGHELSLLIPECCYHSRLVQMKDHLDTRLSFEPTEFQSCDRSGQKIRWEATFGTFSQHGNHVFTAILRDVTRRREAEEMRPTVALHARFDEDVKKIAL